MKDCITRTFTTAIATALVYVDGKIITSEFVIPCGMDTAKAEKFLRKHNPSEKIVTVEKVYTTSITRGMTEADFIANGKVFDARSKETRNLITKTVKGEIGTLLYMTPDYKVERTAIHIRKGEKPEKVMRSVSLPEGCKPIDVIELRPVEFLIGMTEAEFLRYSRPMINNNTWAE